ncbi:DUF4166 domain-containing protein [Lysinimonas soli]|uniref:DUF4166 domain-containing protein n=1 Tax=Lysinimonas soli TaxID=1074233 RepID=A0ABW0NR44_9MICO
MTGSVYQRVLGPRFAELDPSLAAYFSLPPAGHRGHGSGVYAVAGSRLRWARPLWAFLAWRQVLFPELGRGVPFTVVNTPTADGRLTAVRSFAFPGHERVMADAMSVVDGRLHDRLGRRGGLEVELLLDVVDGGLHMTSLRQWLHLGAVRVRIPSVVHVLLAETALAPGASAVPDARQRVDVRMTAPLLGEVFRYTGDFVYRQL